MAKQVILPSNPEDIRKIRGNLQEISDSLTRIQAERSLIKDIKDVLKDDYNLPPKFISKLVKTFHNKDFDTQQAEHSDFEELWDTINLNA